MWLTTSVGADEENELAEVWLEIALENVKKLSSFPDTEGVFDASRKTSPLTSQPQHHPPHRFNLFSLFRKIKLSTSIFIAENNF
jgi:hypothetical protein